MAYKRVNWENLPSTKTPLNATNLNKIEKELDGLNFKNTNYTIGNKIKKMELHNTKYNDYMLIVNEQISTKDIINQYDELVILGDEISGFPNTLFVAVDSNGNTYQLQIYNGGRTCRLLSSNSIPSNTMLGFNCVIVKNR